MAGQIVHTAERKAFEVALKQVGKKLEKDRSQGYVEFVDMIQRVLKDGWPEAAYDGLRRIFAKDGKWTQYMNRLLDEVDRDYLRGMILSLGFEGGFNGFRETRKRGEEESVNIPWVILFDPTSACNLHCTGCWASEYEKQLNLSFEDMDNLVTQGKELGIHAYIMTGGEPLVRKADIVRLAEKHSDCGFVIFTNATLIDQQFCEDMRRCANIILSISIEGDEAMTDGRRGAGTFQRVMAAMDLLKENRIAFGTSICYTSRNYKAVTSDEFYDFLIDKGVYFSWYFHYMPIGMDAATELVPTPEQREYMYWRIREVRGFDGGKPIFCMDFQNDGEFVGGCVAGGKIYCHINPHGDVEPCVFVHYSSANIHDKSLLECLKQPLFREYRARQPFNDNMLKPCPMLENPHLLQEMVGRAGAKSTDMMSPEDCGHLCAKCEQYAQRWSPVADRLWEERHPKAS